MDDILELKRQLEEAKAENERLTNELQYRDKMTGLWNRKYIEKMVEDRLLDVISPNFTAVYADIRNLRKVNEVQGANAGDALYKKIADGLCTVFGKDSICCKAVGTKMCAFLVEEADEVEKRILAFDDFIGRIQVTNPIIEVNYGMARLGDNPDDDVEALMKEAEYDMHVRSLSKEQKDDGAVQPQRKSINGIPTILMIDDSMIILRTYQMMLKDNYFLLLSTSGMEGFEIAKEKQPDLILLDYNMPIVDGERIMRLLKESNSTKNIPVVFVSAVSDMDKILKIAPLNPAGYLLKPVEKDALLNTVHKVLYGK